MMHSKNAHLRGFKYELLFKDLPTFYIFSLSLKQFYLLRTTLNKKFFWHLSLNVLQSPLISNPNTI